MKNSTFLRLCALAFFIVSVILLFQRDPIGIFTFIATAFAIAASVAQKMQEDGL